jgi:hypothetical protein
VRRSIDVRDVFMMSKVEERPSTSICIFSLAPPCCSLVGFWPEYRRLAGICPRSEVTDWLRDDVQTSPRSSTFFFVYILHLFKDSMAGPAPTLLPLPPLPPLPPPPGVYVPVPTFFVSRTAEDYKEFAQPLDLETQARHPFILLNVGLGAL